MSGGVAQNIKANKIISELDKLNSLFVPPGPGDESISIGAAYLESIKQGTDIVGNRVRARVVKNKVAAPFKSAIFEIGFNEGISKEADIIELGVTHEIIIKSGSFYSYGDLKLGQGKESVKNFLKSNDSISKEIESKIMDIINNDEVEQTKDWH